MVQTNVIMQIFYRTTDGNTVTLSESVLSYFTQLYICYQDSLPYITDFEIPLQQEWNIGTFIHLIRMAEICLTNKTSSKETTCSKQLASQFDHYFEEHISDLDQKQQLLFWQCLYSISDFYNFGVSEDYAASRMSKAINQRKLSCEELRSIWGLTDDLSPEQKIANTQLFSPLSIVCTNSIKISQDM